jgi:predicted nucleic acid-binding protein
LKFLVDTNVASEVGRPRANRKVVDWSNSVDPETLYLSVLTLGEISRGIESSARRDPVRAANLQLWFEGLRRLYTTRIIAVDSEIAEYWGRISAKRSLPVVDGLLAATALVHGMTLVSRNGRDFTNIGVATLNPWEI